jgi:hypothetical protein
MASRAKGVGSLEWARRTGGRLGFLDRLTLNLQVVKLRLRRRRIARTSFPELMVDIGDLEVPDSAVAKQGVAIAEKVYEPYLLNHCLRSYLWGRLLAKANGIRYDAELFFVSAILHDLGLTKAHASGRHDEHCFAVSSGRRAAEAMRECGWTSERLDAMEEAITLHLNVLLPMSHGAEAYLLHGGAGIDMIAGRLREIRGVGVDEVLGRHPRLDHKVAITTAIRHQCSIRPHSRIALLERFGFARLVAAAPFAS